MGAAFFLFTQVNDAAASTTKKLRKQAIVAEYLRSLEQDEDLRLAVRFAEGRAFALTLAAVAAAFAGFLVELSDPCLIGTI